MTVARLAESRPQYSYPVPTNRPIYEQEDRVDSAGIAPPGGSLSVQCRRREVSPGNFQFSCEGVDPRKITLSSEHILWLRGPGSENQQLDIVVPNYRVEELIRAALKASKGGATNVNILLKKPETVYDVQAQDGGAVPNAKPSVNLQYEQVRGKSTKLVITLIESNGYLSVLTEPLSVHYPVEQAYNPLSGPIREP